LIYIETEASERDQIMRACAAQNDKLLPKRAKGNSADRLRASTSKYFPSSTDK